MKECKCAAWQKHVNNKFDIYKNNPLEELNAPFYFGAEINFCPWCGNNLQQLIFDMDAEHRDIQNINERIKILAETILEESRELSRLNEDLANLKKQRTLSRIRRKSTES